LGPLLASQPRIDHGKLFLLALARGGVGLTRLFGKATRTGEVASRRSQSARQIELDIGKPAGTGRLSLVERKRPFEQRNCLLGRAENKIHLALSSQAVGFKAVVSSFLLDGLAPLVQGQRFLVFSLGL